MQPSIYKFTINGVEVFPHYKTLQKKYSLENNQMFFRSTLEGDIKLYGNDYFLIKNSSLSAEFTLIVQKKVGSEWVNYYEGTFSKTDCTINIDKREVKIKLSAKDEYTTILNNYSNEYNLADLSPKLTSVKITKRPILQVYTYEDSIINNFLPSGETWEQEVDLGDMTMADILYNQHFSTLAVLVEIRIDNGSVYDGIYTGDNKTLHSLNNTDYYIAGTSVITDKGTTFNYKLYKVSDTQMSNPLYTTGETSTSSKYGLVQFKNPNNSNDYFTANITTHFVFMRLITGASSMFTGEVTDGKLDEGSFGYIDGYSYAYVVTGCAAMLLAAADSQEPTKYGKSENGLYYQPPTSTYNHFYPFSRSTWDYTSKWLRLDEKFTSYYDMNAQVFSELKDCIHIVDAISCLLKEVSPSLVHEATPEYSSFFYGQKNPVYGDVLNLFITQKSNVLKFTYDEPAKKIPVTFESIMNMIKKCFNCYWYIEDGKFKIEHKSYFLNGRTYSDEYNVGLDLTSMYDNRNGKLLTHGQNTISYDKGKLSSRYEFSYMDDVSIEFEGAAVKLTAAYLQQDKTESITVDSFNADIDMMLSNPDGTSKDGFALLAAEHIVGEDYEYYSTFLHTLTLYDERGVSYDVKLQNGVLSWLNLVNFYLTDMPTTVAEYDGYPKLPLRITGVSRFMKQSIDIPTDEDPDLYSVVKTDIGYGYIESVSIDITTKKTSIELSYEPQ